MHEPVGPAWLVWLELSRVAMAMRQSAWGYPIVEIVHIAGFTVLVGAAAMFDLRLLGVSRRLPVSDVAGYLLPWARAALVLIVPSGALMFIAHATEMASNPAFRLKLLCLAAAGLNVALFHLGPYKTVGAWNRLVPAPRRAKTAAILSLVLWAAVITCGRLIAYL
ncbi:MAG: hypothetical protein L0027_08665 [Candidatus Rokubacteria bacterium]|nr:hypothetical protein [Candidatus Rokubacteria bacterium]